MQGDRILNILPRSVRMILKKKISRSEERRVGKECDR